MIKRTIFVILPAMILITASCTTLKRYSSQKTSGTDSSLADIDLFSSRLKQDIPQTSGKTLMDLTADAQSQFIRIMNTRYPSNEKFLNALKYEFQSGNMDIPVVDYVRKDLRLVFSVSKKHDFIKTVGLAKSELSQADRIEYLKISLQIEEPSLKFTGWDMYATEYGSINIGDVSFTGSLDTDVSASAGNVKDSKGSLTADVKPSVSKKEDQSVMYRYIKLNGRLNDTVIVMEEEGTRENDLTGNIIADVSLKFKSTEEVITRIKSLKDSTGTWLTPEKVQAETFLAEVPDIDKIKPQIRAKLTMDFVYRNVKCGRKTFPEWDDRIKYYTGHREKHVSLLRDTSYVPKFYCIGSGLGGTRKSFAEITENDGRSHTLILGTWEEANAFFVWMKDYLIRNEGKTLKLGSSVLRFNDADLTLKVIQADKRFGVIPYYW
jgi:hypothetical protein